MIKGYLNSGCLVSVIGMLLCHGQLKAQLCPPGSSPVVINEIHYNPPSALDAGDWVELYNPNASLIDISAD